MIKRYLLSFITACSLVIVSCQAKETPDNNLSSPVVITATPVAATRTSQVRPTQQATPTRMPFHATSFLLAPDALEKLLYGNYVDECNLPCWWGIVPTASTMTATMEMFSGLLGEPAIIYDMPSRDPFAARELTYDFYDGSYGSLYAGSLYIRGRNNTVNDLIVIGNWVFDERISLRGILSRNGIPDEISLYTMDAPYGEGVLPFVTLLDYSSKGFVVYYDGDAYIDSETSKVTFCYPTDSTHVEMHLWDPVQGDPSNVLGSPSYPGAYADKVVRINLVTELTKDEFITKAIAQNGEDEFCLSTPPEYWQTGN